MVKVPLWVVENLGGLVKLSRPFNSGVALWPAGTMCKLVSIQAGAKGHRFATVEILASSSGSEENVDFNRLRPALLGTSNNRVMSR